MDTKQKLRIKFVDFWPNFSPQGFYLYEALRKEFDLIESDEPELVFYSVFGIDHLNYSCLKVFYTAENYRPDFSQCDFSFSFLDTDEKNFLFPNFVRHPFFFEFVSHDYGAELQELRSQSKTNFCNFIYSNPGAKERQSFCKKLMEYKRVDCPGRVLNNMEPFDKTRYAVKSKLEFQSQYKFTLAFENEGSRNYFTEKIYHPLLVNSVPIYWGDPGIADYFNSASFINCHDFATWDEVLERIEEIDSDDGLYESYSKAVPILPDSKLREISDQTIKKRLSNIVASREDFAHRRTTQASKMLGTIKYLLEKAKKKIRAGF